MKYSMLKKAGTLALAAVLAGCVYVPKKVTYYNEKCQAYDSKYVLARKHFAPYKGNTGPTCDNEGCLLGLAFLGAAAAVSGPVTALASGTAAATGNAAIWVKSGGQCRPAA